MSHFKFCHKNYLLEAKIRRTSSVVRGDCCRLLLRYYFVLLSCKGAFLWDDPRSL